MPDRWFDRDILKVHVTNEEYLVTLYDSYSSHIKQTDYEQIYLIDKFNEIVNSYSYQIAATDYYGNTTDAIASPDGSVIFGMSRNHLYLWNRNSAELFRTVSIDRFDNTEFVEIINPHMIKMRSFERGCGETPACGTGACAAVAAAVMNGCCKKGEDVTVKVSGGDLVVNFTDEEVRLTGQARQVYTGVVAY